MYIYCWSGLVQYVCVFDKLYSLERVLCETGSFIKVPSPAHTLVLIPSYCTIIVLGIPYGNPG